MSVEKKTKKELLKRVLSMISRGTKLRQSIEHIISANTGALIVIADNDEVLQISNGGFELFCQATPQKIY
ncbi:MAG: DNA integrity scanning protein DisA, partial [Actinobacteria bacterium]